MASVALLATALLLTACSAGEASAPSESESVTDSGWPRTVEVPAADGTSGQLTLEAQPERIAALDFESAETIAEVGMADRLVLIPAAVLNPALGGHIEQLSDVEQTFPVAMEVEAETVIALEPDLVVMSPRHGTEAPIAAVLEQVGIPVLELPSSWTGSESMITNIGLIGQAVGAEEQAAALATELEERLTDAGRNPADGPSVLVLTNQAGRPFATAGEAMPIELLQLAGAQDAAAGLGMHRTGPISAEQIVQADPDGIVLIDMNGSGDSMYAPLLENDAVASLAAVSEGRILRLDGRQVQALGLTETIDGLAALTDWVGALDSI